MGYLVSSFLEVGSDLIYYESPLDLKPEVTLSLDGHVSILFTDNDSHLRLVTLLANETANSLELLTSQVVADTATHYDVAYVHEKYTAIAYSFFDDDNITMTIQTVLGYEEDGALQLLDGCVIADLNPITFLHFDSWNQIDPSDLHLILTYISDRDTDGLIVNDVRLDTNRMTFALGPRISNRNSAYSGIDSTGVHHLEIVMLENRKFMVSMLLCFHVGLLFEHSERWIHCSAGFRAVAFVGTDVRRTAVHPIERQIRGCCNKETLLWVEERVLLCVCVGVESPCVPDRVSIQVQRRFAHRF